MRVPRRRWTRAAPGDGGARRGSRRWLPALRRPILRAAGQALVAEDAIGPADVIVLGERRRSDPGALEVADLVHERRGHASRGLRRRARTRWWIASSSGEEFPGKTQPREPVRQLRALGVEAVEIIPTPVGGTEDQGRVLPPWCDRNGFRSVVVVTEDGPLAPSAPSAAPLLQGASNHGHGAPLALLGVRSRPVVGNPRRGSNRDRGAREAPARRRASPAPLKRRRRQLDARSGEDRLIAPPGADLSRPRSQARVVQRIRAAGSPTDVHATVSTVGPTATLTPNSADTPSASYTDTGPLTRPRRGPRQPGGEGERAAGTRIGRLQVGGRITKNRSSRGWTASQARVADRH